MARAHRSLAEVGDYEQPSYTPAMNMDDQEDQLIALATELAIKRLRDGTASNQLVSEIIKFGTAKERLAREKLQRENELLRAKTEALRSSEENKRLYAEAIKAMGIYSGTLEDNDDELNEDY